MAFFNCWFNRQNSLRGREFSASMLWILPEKVTISWSFRTVLMEKSAISRCSSIKPLTGSMAYGLMRPVARIAQSVEQGIENPRVPGSIPGSGTIFRKTRLWRVFCFLRLIMNLFPETRRCTQRLVMTSLCTPSKYHHPPHTLWSACRLIPASWRTGCPEKTHRFPPAFSDTRR